ncbi:MAG: class I SAM-dependent methyltransferase [Gemmatimonadetes bacterium]|nr:class I SAM-dependent methyltransferase [Gemmatimonadota bacterium]
MPTLHEAVEAERVKRINAIFHDAEARLYENRHPEIFDGLSELLVRAIGRLSRDRGIGAPRRAVDVGTGTGFMPMTLRRATRAGGDAQWVLCDISYNMLRVARERVTSAGCRVLGCVAMDAERSALRPGVADLVTASSVLHHLPDPARFVQGCRQILRPGGHMLVAHEPRRGFYASAVSLPARAALQLLRIVGGVRARLRRSGTRAPDRTFWDEVQRGLEGAGFGRMAPDEVQRLVDYHSPTAGARLDTERGLRPKELFGDGWTVVASGTYGHLGKLALKAPRRRLLGRIERLLARAFPRSGSLFYVLAERAHE